MGPAQRRLLSLVLCKGAEGQVLVVAVPAGGGGSGEGVGKPQGLRGRALVSFKAQER